MLLSSLNIDAQAIRRRATVCKEATNAKIETSDGHADLAPSSAQRHDDGCVATDAFAGGTGGGVGAEAAELDGYFSDTPLNPEPKYPKLNESFGPCVIITNLPKIGEEKVEKLTKVVTKLVSRIGTLAANEATGFSGRKRKYIMPLTLAV